MGKSDCCNAEIIKWFGKVQIKFSEQELPYSLLCMKCGKACKKKKPKQGAL